MQRKGIPGLLIQRSSVIFYPCHSPFNSAVLALLYFDSVVYIEDITRWREDMNFILKCCFCYEKIKFISSSCRVMFFLLCRQKDIDKIIYN